MTFSTRGTPSTPDQIAIGGYRSLTLESKEAHTFLWAGRVTHVDSETMVCSIRMDTGIGEWHDVPIPSSGGSGPRSWSGSIPEIGSKVILSWKKFGARSYKIIQFLTSGIYLSRDFEPFSSINPADAASALEQIPDLENDPGINLSVTRLKMRKVYEGDYLASSSGGSDILLDKDALITNRAGNEIRLRDSDQTVILQSINEFTSNAAGYYKRGLIKRNAFSFLPDLYPANSDGSIPAVIGPDNGAYTTLKSFGLIDEEGNKTFPDYPDEPFYPHVVVPDGQHVAYVVQGEHDNSFSETAYSYIEDRVELRHVSDGIMTVTEEGDGFQVDPPFPVFIEDVRGTVVGNDFHSESGRALYKKILKMRIFSDPDQAVPSTAPILEEVDTIQDQGILDDIALARLFRIFSPNGSNQYAFGVSKEGRVFLHVPKSRVGTADMKGKSIDASIQGLVKMVIGADENTDNRSMDLKMSGGMNLDIGRHSNGTSVNLTLRGKIRKIHLGNDNNGLTNEELYGGSTSRTVSASEMIMIGGNSAEDIGAEKAIRATSISLNSGAGGMKTLVAGDVGVTVLGKTQEQFGREVSTTWALGKKTKVVTGIDDHTILAGTKSTTVIAGSISRTVTTGSITDTVVTGNFSQSVTAGNMSLNVGAGSFAISNAGGPNSMTSSLTNTLTAGISNQLNAPINQIGAISVGFCVAGIPGPPAPHRDYITGIPILGIPTILVG